MPMTSRWRAVLGLSACDDCSMSSDAVSSVGDVLSAPLRAAEALPFVGSLARGVRRRVASTVDDVVAQLIRAIVAALAAEVDLTRLVIDNVDIDAIIARVDLDGAVTRVDLMAIVSRLDVDAVVAQVDLDAAVARVDLNAAIHRADLIGVANEIIDGVDLPAIIRDASTSVTAEVMTDVRSGGERADDAVSEFVGRMLGRSRSGLDGD